MIIRRAILLACCLLLPLSAPAQESARTYTIKQGDTLWGISERFLSDPDYWPSLWSHNPYITNPHFIYPGQKVAIYDGRIEIIPVEPPAPEVVSESPEPPEATEPAPPPPPKPRPAITVKGRGGTEGFLSLDDLESTGTLIDTVDNRILLAEGDKVFLQMNDLASVAPGDAFSLFETGKEVTHPVTGEPLGVQVANLGNLLVTEINPTVATAVITASVREIERGARLVPFSPPAMEIVLKRQEREISGYIVAAGDNKIALSQFDVVYLDLGAEDGLEVGNLLYVSRPRKPSEAVQETHDLQLPDVLLGAAVVLDVRKGTASALVLKTADTILRGDRVTTATE